MALFQNPYSKTSILPPQGDIMNIIMMLRLLPMIQQMMQGQQGQGQGQMAPTGMPGGRFPMQRQLPQVGGGAQQLMQGAQGAFPQMGMPQRPPQMPMRPF